MSGRVSWMRDDEILDLETTPAEAADYLPLEEVAARLLLAQSTVRDLLSRPRKPAGHRYEHISRPVARIRNCPYYSKEQVAATREAIARENEEVRRQQDERARPLTLAEIGGRDLVSMSDIAERTGYAVGSLRRWCTEAGFPERVGERELLTGPGRSEVVWEWTPVRKWLIATGRQTTPVRTATRRRGRTPAA